MTRKKAEGGAAVEGTGQQHHADGEGHEGDHDDQRRGPDELAGQRQRDQGEQRLRRRTRFRATGPSGRCATSTMVLRAWVGARRSDGGAPIVCSAPPSARNLALARGIGSFRSPGPRLSAGEPGNLSRSRRLAANSALPPAAGACLCSPSCPKPSSSPPREARSVELSRARSSTCGPTTSPLRS